MAPRRQNFPGTPIEKLRYVLLDNRMILGLVATFLVIAGLFAAAGSWFVSVEARPIIREEGEIVRFGPGQSRLASDILVVVVRTKDGRLQTLRGTQANLLRCRAGDRIRLIRHGNILHVASPACAPPA